MYSTSDFFQVFARPSTRERLAAMLARYGVPTAVCAAVMAGIVLGGLVPALPLELVTVLG